MCEEFSNIPSDTSNSDYRNYNLLYPDHEFSSELEDETKRCEIELHYELINQELAELSLSKFHKLYKHLPNFQECKIRRRRGQKTDNTYIRRKSIKKTQLMIEKAELIREIQQYKYLLEQGGYHFS